MWEEHVGFHLLSEIEQHMIQPHFTMIRRLHIQLHDSPHPSTPLRLHSMLAPQTTVQSPLHLPCLEVCPDQVLSARHMVSMFYQKGNWQS